MKSPNECTTLAEIRSEIDRLDRAVVEAIGQRREYVRAASRFKRSESEVQAPDRQRKMLAARRSWAEEEGADPDLVEALFREIVAHFIAVEMTEFSGPEAEPTLNPHQPPSDKAASGEPRGKASA
ncbi:MAG: chorismate mutase family protein [Caldilineaceae bacterium]|nr:chorismate mutase family protein [Caldilineaceae bacterium]MDE0183052.1 chorismate mutase family protein [Caldilineaceae bacterium]